MLPPQDTSLEEARPPQHSACQAPHRGGFLSASCTMGARAQLSAWPTAEATQQKRPWWVIVGGMLLGEPDGQGESQLPKGQLRLSAARFWQENDLFCCGEMWSGAAQRNAPTLRPVTLFASVSARSWEHLCACKHSQPWEKQHLETANPGGEETSVPTAGKHGGNVLAALAAERFCAREPYR